MACVYYTINQLQNKNITNFHRLIMKVLILIIQYLVKKVKSLLKMTFPCSLRDFLTEIPIVKNVANSMFENFHTFIKFS